MSTWAGTPAASACTAWARPISPPSGVTAELSAMFCALNGRDAQPLAGETAGRARSTSRLLPTDEAVPCTMMAGRLARASSCARAASRRVAVGARAGPRSGCASGRPKEAQSRTRMRRRASSRCAQPAASPTGPARTAQEANGCSPSATQLRARARAVIGRAARGCRRRTRARAGGASRRPGPRRWWSRAAAPPRAGARERGRRQQVADAQPGDGVVLGQRAHAHDVGRACATAASAERSLSERNDWSSTSVTSGMRRGQRRHLDRRHARPIGVFGLHR